MISFEIRVNGSLICAINCVNRGVVSMDTETGVTCTYEWASTEFPYELNGPPIAKHGTLLHVRRDGALVLARDLFARVLGAESDPDEWERMFSAWVKHQAGLPSEEPLWPNPEWSQDVAMVAHALASLEARE